MGDFTAALTGLTTGTIYYARAYATTIAGTTYGSEVFFTTLTPTLTVVTGTATSFGYNTSMDFTTAGTATILSQGIVFSKKPNPTTNSSKVNAPVTPGKHTIFITPLDYCTIYYAKAYATIAGGTTIYGNEVTFKSTGNPLNDCHPFNGFWGFSATNSDVIFDGNRYDFDFYSMTPQSPTSNTWDGARQRGLIGLKSTSYIKDIVQVSSNTWKCISLWRNGNSSGVFAVKYSTSGTLVLSADEKTIVLTSVSPFTNTTASVTLYKQ